MLGKWVGFEGLVYDYVDIREVIIEPFEIPNHWQRTMAIDFGYTNPFVAQWWARCPDEEATDTVKGWYLYREVYHSKRTVNEHAALINSFMDLPDWVVADWDAEDRATLEEHGIFTIQANKEVGPGIQTVYGLFSQNMIHFFSNARVGAPDEAMREQHRPTSTGMELPNYRWAALPKDRNIKEIPMDRDNHGMDACRYNMHTFETMNYALNSHVLKEKNSRFAPRDWGNFLVRDRRYRNL